MVRKKQLTMEETQTIVTLKNVGFSYREIAKRVRVSESTVSFTIKSYSETAAKTACGSKDNSFKHKLNSSHGNQVSASTVNRRLRPLLRRKNKRLAWAMKQNLWATEHWKGQQPPSPAEDEGGLWIRLHSDT
uniref:Transposase IS30-like HTH domain-containing protein n=1 Tax=Haplochromis burtoni TaxID=8153 RepID=A0A3Q3C9E0_HAPBU